MSKSNTTTLFEALDEHFIVTKTDLRNIRINPNRPVAKVTLQQIEDICEILDLDRWEVAEILLDAMP
jgi:DNA-binding Xre family transcriptional regulator